MAQLRRPTRTYSRLVALFTSVLAVGLAAACNTAADAHWHAAGSGADGATKPSAQLTITPAADATSVSPLDPAKVEVSSGSLDSVALTNPAGKEVTGEYDANHLSWQSNEKLGYDKTYTFTVKATGEDGQSVEKISKFTTVKPDNLTYPYLRANVYTLLGKGKTFGVGQPVIVWFDEPIKDKAAAQRTLTVTTDPPVTGAWHWFTNQEVHWRPQQYWTPGTKVTVKADVYGHDLGGGLYGQEDVSASFTIGESHIAIADSKTHRMKVYIGGKQVTTISGHDVSAGIPVSLGRDQTTTGADGQVIDLRTYSGPHVVINKQPVVHMTSASYGITDKSSPYYYDSMVKLGVRISYSGEYVHLADWNIWAQGKVNTSHGCINVAPVYIKWFYNIFQTGDVVEVKNTGKTLSPTDGNGDWVLSWDKWVAGSALN